MWKRLLGCFHILLWQDLLFRGIYGIIGITLWVFPQKGSALLKRIFALVLTLALVFTALPGTAQAKKEEKPLDKYQQAIRDARRSYTRALSSSGKTSMHGYCGLMTSHQLRSVGINSWVATYNGKDQYDAYCDKTVTSGGYYIKAYSATADMTLRDVLNLISQNGTRDVYNIMLGFQRTRTAAGSKYGHSCFINAILDGMVYMVESSNTRFGPEGQVIIAPLEEVADYYEGYAHFEGAIWFGTGSYADSCESITTDLVLQTRYDSLLRSLPSPVGQNGCVTLRSVYAGERLQADELLTDTLGQRYYKITDGEFTGFIAAGACSVISTGTESIALEDVSVTDAGLSGTVTSTGGRITGLRATVADETGAVVAFKTIACDDYSTDLSSLQITGLSEGVYTLQVQVGTVCAADGALMPRLYDGKVQLRQSLAVGQEQPPQTENTQSAPVDGWVLREGKWYFYETGKARTGWFNYCGIRYCLDETGAALTGWQELEGMKLRFSETGALCAGWLQTEEGMTFREQTGESVSGVRRIDSALYGFDYKGLLVTEGQVTVGGTIYEAAADGRLSQVQ